MTNFQQNLLGSYGIKAICLKPVVLAKYLSYLQVVFVLPQISLISIDNCNVKQGQGNQCQTLVFI